VSIKSTGHEANEI